MSRLVVAILFVTTLGLAACTGESEPAATETADGATETDGADGAEGTDGAAADPGPGTAVLSLDPALTPLSIDVDALAGTEPVEAAFSPSALEVVGTSFHVFGQLATPDGAAQPAIYRSALEDGRSWEPVDLELDDDVVTGGISLVDAPGVSVLWARDDERRTSVQLRRRTAEPRLVATIDDADNVSIRNVAADGDGFVAVGTRRDDGVRNPAIWQVDGGEVTPIELPDDPRLDRRELGFDAAVVFEDRYHVAGWDSAARELVWLEGDALDTLEVVDVPDGLDDARRIRTMLVADDVLWLGGSALGVVSGQYAIWSRAGSDTRFYARTDAIWEDRESFTSSANRLVSGSWPSGAAYVAVVSGDRTRWWSTRGEDVVEVGQFGGTVAAYSPIGDDSAVTYDSQVGTWEVGFESAEVDLPAPLWVQEVPGIGSRTADLLTIGSGGNDAARTLVLDADGEQPLGELEGALSIDDHTDLAVLYGTAEGFPVRPAAARVVDGELVGIDLDIDEESRTARATAVISDGEEHLILGHQFSDERLQPMAWVLDGAEVARTDRFDEVLDARGFASACGPTTVRTYDERVRGISWPFADGGLSEVLIEDRFGAVAGGACVEAPDGTVWLAGGEQLLAVSQDGTVEEYEQAALRGVFGLRLVEVDGAEHLIAFVDDDSTTSGFRPWTAPIDDPGQGTALEPLDLPSELGSVTVRGFDPDTLTYLFTARVGTVHEGYELQLAPA